MKRPLFEGFIYQDEILLPDGQIIIPGPPVHNRTPQQGISFIAGLVMGNQTPISNWYMFLYEGNYAPTWNESAADISAMTECTAYVAASRPEFVDSYDGVSSIDNLANKAKFVMTADKTIYGAGIVSNSGKGGNSGVLISLTRFPSPRVLAAGTEYTLGAAIPLISNDF